MNIHPFFVIVSAAALLLSAGCSTGHRPNPTASVEDTLPACCQPTNAPAPIKFSDESLFHSEGTWVTDSGNSLRLGDLAGKPQVVAMFFASCRYTCPVLVNDMRRIEAALSPAARARTGFTLVSFDSRRDSPEALAAYREISQLPKPAWTLLRGEPDDVLELSALLGVSFKEDARGDFAHSNQITILNADGEIVERLVGLNRDVAETAALLERLAAN